MIRDGTVVSTLVTKSYEIRPVEQIIGHPLSMTGSKVSGTERLTNGTPAVAVSDLAGEYVHGVTFEIGEGEILGMSGLLGSGFTDIPYLLFGAKKAPSGVMRIGEVISLSNRDQSPSTAVEKGMALIPVDRRGQGLVEELSIVENISLPVLKDFGPWRLQHSNLKEVRKPGERL